MFKRASLTFHLYSGEVLMEETRRIELPTFALTMIREVFVTI
jgi:hypothetical protein